ncbi:MAG: acetyl-CoA C-acyltransferase, partial [Myxococcales bacterium]|nr:acetyl-CoA C-acyltransferase [Myxococcales bacterium]
MKEAVIVSAVRTPAGRGKRGNLRDTRPEDLMAIAIKGAMERVPGLTGEMVDDLIVGCAMPEGEQGMNIARLAGALAGLPYTVAAMTVNRFCSSGLQTVAQAAERVMVGACDVVVAGGVESMSIVPMGGNKPSPHPGLMENDPKWYTPMGNTAELVAQRFEVSRADQDAFALRSHQRALAAQAAGRFDEELVPVETVVYGEGGPKAVTVSADEGPRADTTLEALGKLKAVFAVNGSVTAGNSSQVSDGAAA